MAVVFSLFVVSACVKPSRIPKEADRLREKGMPEQKLEFTGPQEGFSPRPK